MMHLLSLFLLSIYDCNNTFKIDSLGFSRNAIGWQIWSALLTYLPMRIMAYLSNWKRDFKHFFTLMKGALWAKHSVNLIVSRYGTAEDTPPPEETQLPPPICRVLTGLCLFDMGQQRCSTPRLAILEHFEKRLATLHGIYSPVLPPHQTLLRHFQSLPDDRLRFSEYL